MSNFTLNVETEKSSGKVHLVPEGRIDSSTVTIFSNAVIAFCKEHHLMKEIIFDCRGLQYISSAGLRVLLSIKKKENVSIKLINVSAEVDDIFEVTGFSQLFEVSKGIRDISNIELQMMGKIGGMTLYRMPDGNLLKLYSAGTEYETVEKELQYTRTAFMSGVPVLISYETVMCRNRYGIIYEMPLAKTVSAMIGFQREKFNYYASEMGKTLKLIHSCKPQEGILPKISGLYENYVSKMKDYLHDYEVEKLKAIVKSIPEAPTIVYGNYHSGNVFVQNDELILINMSGAGTGNPLYDLARTYLIYVLEAEWLSQRLTGLDKIQSRMFWNVMIRSYLETDDEKAVKRAEGIIHVAALLHSALMPVMGDVSQENTERLIANAKRDLFPIFDVAVQLFSGSDFLITER